MEASPFGSRPRNAPGAFPRPEASGSAVPIRVAILGSTGSIGVSTLNVIARHPGRFQVAILTANRSVGLLAEQVTAHRPRRAVVADPEALEDSGREDARAEGGGDAGGHDRAGGVPPGPDPTTGTEWAAGREAVLAAAEDPEVDVVVNALVGFAGLEPTLRALRAGKRVALANKESLVAGGDLVLQALRENGGELIPVDSEHSAILQCLEGCHGEDAVARLLLTASGGPFRGWGRERLARVTPAEALRHPTWEMGAKISIDSATLANKALEVIEAHVLYGIDYARIDVVVHPQSIIHSLVEFVDGSVLAQMGFPNMELPILYALTYPERVQDARLRGYDPVRSSPLTFEEVDHEAFPLFGIGVEAGRRGGTAPAAFNAANEVAVAAFLEERVSLLGVADAVRAGLEGAGGRPVTRLQEIIEADRRARRLATEWISRAKSPTTGT